MSGTNQKGDTTIMKKHSRIIFVMAACLAGFIGQSGALAASTNSVWGVTVVSTLSVDKAAATSDPATFTFLSDGTFGVLVGSTALDGTYTNTTKSLTLTFSTNSVASLESNVVNIISSDVSPEVVVTFKSSKLSKIKLKDGVPGKVTDKISGKGSLTEGTKTRSKSFSFTYLFTDWTNTFGTTF
jgi:hypothetical protein